MSRATAWQPTDKPCKVCGAAALTRTRYVDVAQSSHAAREDAEMRCSTEDCLSRYGTYPA
jgi:hypothetical protein